MDNIKTSGDVKKILHEKLDNLCQKCERSLNINLDLDEFLGVTSADKPLWNLLEESWSEEDASSQIKQNSDQTLMRYKEDSKSFASRQNSDLSVLSKTLHAALPLKATVSEVDDEECCVKYPAGYNDLIHKAEDSGSLDNEEASYLDPGNKTLGDMYPQMIENFSRILDFNIKKQAADNVVRSYKHHFWPKKKILKAKVNRRMPQSVNRTYTIGSAPVFEEIVSPSKPYNSRMLHLREPMKGSSPGFSQGQKFSSPVGIVSVSMHLNPQSSPSKAFEGSQDNVSISQPSPFLPQVLKNYKRIMPPETDPFSYCKDSEHLQQNISRRNYFTDFMSLSPKKVITTPNSYMSESTKSPSKAMTTKSQKDIERNHESYKEYTKQLQNRTCTCTMSNSFSLFPVSHSPSRDFESVDRNLTPSRTQADLSLGKAQFQLPKTVYSLVISPGTQGAKRPLSHDFPMSKKPRSATEYLFGRTNPVYKSIGSSDLSWVESSSSNQHHSIVASSVETHMLSYSPVSLRSFPRAVNDRSPMRTNARTFGKISYPENNEAVNENLKESP